MSNSKYLTRYALSRTSNDRWPIEFLPDCEITTKGETLLNVLESLNKSGYDLFHSRDDLIKELEKRGVGSVINGEFVLNKEK